MSLSTDDGWELIVSLNETNVNSPSLVFLGEVDSGTLLACKVGSNSKRTTWYSGGKLWNSYFLGEEYYLDKSWNLKLDFNQLIKIPSTKIEPRGVLFYEPPKWFRDFEITIWENKNMALYVDNQPASFTALTASSVSVTVNSHTNAVSVLAANTNRKGYSIRNRGNKPVLIGFSSTFTASSAFLSLAAGAMYESEKLYLGEIFGLMTAVNNTTDLTIIEFI